MFLALRKRAKDERQGNPLRQSDPPCEESSAELAQSSRLAKFGGRGMSFNICRGTIGSLVKFAANRKASSRVSTRNPAPAFLLQCVRLLLAHSDRRRGESCKSLFDLGLRAHPQCDQLVEREFLMLATQRL